MAALKKIVPCLWFDTQAEDAAKFYTSVFRNSKITKTVHYGKAGQEIHGRPPGSVMTVAFELDGHAFTALNGGPHFKFNEALSLEVHCDSQEEIDYFWERLSKDGDPKAQQCGWLKDKYGLSWQIVPDRLVELMSDQEPARSERVMTAMLKMKKLDLSALERAAA